MALSEEQSAEFLKLYTANQSRLYAFILTLTGDSDVAAEVLQNTNLVLWEKRSQHRPGTNFMAWAFKIARFQVMAYRKKQKRDRLVFSDRATELIANACIELDESYETRQADLHRCVEKLPPKLHQLIQMRYSGGQSLEMIAKAMGRSYAAVGQGLHRARKALSKCIEERRAS